VKSQNNIGEVAGRWLLDTRCWMLDTGYSMLDIRYWMLDGGIRLIDAGHWFPWSLVPGY
jgi:hypothetical protein